MNRIVSQILPVIQVSPLQIGMKRPFINGKITKTLTSIDQYSKYYPLNIAH